ncbi:innexin inx1 isoform X2 [Agrilus planipennis]|uniref:Innexin n=1 Tax=Agrilus planipennis TaxID=224129 RepID=A0A7F5RDK2_AGRPL|nr:innexin inx1 isoform X2 [Agrilus planipennis]
MYQLLSCLKEYFKVQEVTTDCSMFRFHCILTTVLLLTCSLVITGDQLVGKPIECITGDGVPNKVVNTYCWISSTFTMPDAFKRQVGKEVAHPGIANDFDDEDAQKYYTYYQWVCFVLFFQGLACYTPKFLWDIWEGGLMKTLVMGLHIGICHEKEKKTKKKILIEYLMQHLKVIFNFHFYQ